MNKRSSLEREDEKFTATNLMRLDIEYEILEAYVRLPD